MPETKRPTSAAAEEILGGYFPVLDHGFVSLVDYMGTDEDIERAARVSYGYGTRKVSATRGLIRYLRRHAHTTPSEMVEFKFHCAMPIFVARQWIRHRTACLAAGTRVYFDLPGGIDRRGNQPYEISVEDLWARLQPARNTTRHDKQRNSYRRRDRIRALRLRQVNEDTLDIQHTRLVDVMYSGPRPVFRMTLSDGKQIEATSDHRFLFADGWKTLRAATGLEMREGRACWNAGDHYVYANGSVAEELEPANPLSARPIITKRATRPRVAFNTLTKATLVRIESFQYRGLKDTYDLEVEGPFHNFVAEGIITHNSVNEYSGRYSLMPLLFYEPAASSFALQSRTNNQGREAEPAPADLYAEAIARWERAREQAADTYGWLVVEDVARELARIDLPLSTYTQWYWKIDLHNLLHFLRLRVDAHAQWEIQEYGRVMAGMLARVAPLSYEAWLDYEVLGERITDAERRALHQLLVVEGDRVASRPGASPLGADGLEEFGMSAREVREFLAKLEPRERPDFHLDLSLMRSADEMAARLEAAVPGGSA